MNGIQLEKFLLIKEVIFAVTCGHKQCIDNFILPNWNCLNYRPTDTDTILEENRKICQFYSLYKKV